MQVFWENKNYSLLSFIKELNKTVNIYYSSPFCINEFNNDEIQNINFKLGKCTYKKILKLEVNWLISDFKI
jgi:hypothetical protein